MDRIYHHYTKWEEYTHGMWRKIPKNEESSYKEAAYIFTGDHELYGRYMRIVTSLWKYSCEHNLTNDSINRQAWIGHAACCFAIGCPEYIVRSVWWSLTSEQRRLANEQADNAIMEWENRYAKT